MADKVADYPRESTPQEKLQDFLTANNLTIGLVMVSKAGSTVTLVDALDTHYAEWQPSIVVSNGKNDDNRNG